MSTKLSGSQIKFLQKSRKIKTIYLDTVVYGELYEKFRNDSVDLLLIFIKKFNLTVIGSPAIEREISKTIRSDLFEGVARQYFELHERMIRVNEYDKSLRDDLVKKFGEDKESDMTHLAMAISVNADLFTSFNKHFIIKNMKTIEYLVRRHGYKKIPEIINTNELIEQIKTLYSDS